jgi:hypothetical protein
MFGRAHQPPATGGASGDGVMKRSTFGLAPFAAALVLSSCLNTSDVLEPTALDTVEPPAQAAEVPAATPPAADAAAPETSPETVAAIREPARLRLSPVVGATAEAAAPLNARLTERAGSRGVTLVSGSAPADFEMKGYFSAIAENGETSVIYVWDVLDMEGNRVHRIQGRQRTSSGADGWASVDPATMQAIADQTVEQFAAWAATRPG